MPSGVSGTNQGNAGYMVFANLDGVGAGSVNSADIPAQTLLNVNVCNEMTPTFYKWVADSLKCGVAKSGSLVSTDYSRKVIFWDDWIGGQVNTLVFPAVDASSAARLSLSLSMQCKDIRRRSDAPGKYDGCAGAKRSSLLSKNFKLSIDGIPDCCHVMSVDSMTAGGKTGGKPASPDLSLTIKETHAAGFRTWQQTQTRKCGSFSYLTPNMNPIFELAFGGLVIASISPAVPLNPTALVTVKLHSSTFDFRFWPN